MDAVAVACTIIAATGMHWGTYLPNDSHYRFREYYFRPCGVAITAWACMKLPGVCPVGPHVCAAVITSKLVSHKLSPMGKFAMQSPSIVHGFAKFSRFLRCILRFSVARA